ncbi:2-amino-4-hydroxy-6-hydroxymethyldihydropteridinepyrophosphokinase [hydrothermal vent metagenome]|uniref:2-amino-4-hydroxy-6-hydroxymethyldihydropteridine diphosphokinase n=1 Tax=hydrothermal vent metagenome TaxID=652676 RepID=A0A3B1CQ39_9ZZZZ
MAVVYLSIGSNMDDPEGSVAGAVGEILKDEGVELIGQGGYYETEPQGNLDQPWFVNTAVALKVDFSAGETLDKMKKIENKMGRKRSVKWGPRKIDIDIIFYDDLVMDTADLKIPHPLAFERRFVLQPLKDIDPELTHPALGETVSELLKKLPQEKQHMRKIEAP